MAISFTQFRDLMAAHFKQMTKDVPRLYTVDVEKDEMWNMYLDSFAPEDNTIFRERREHDCSCCRQFIKAIGNAVAIKDGVITTIWDFEAPNSAYEPVLKKMSEYIKAHPVTEVFLSRFNDAGTWCSRESLPDGRVLTFDHLFVSLPQRFVFNGRGTIPEAIGNQRDIRNVFKRSLEEISLESVDTVLELIRSNTLYRGKEWERNLESFREYKLQYEPLSAEQRELFAWEKSAEAGAVIGKIRNHSIGVLLTDITEGVDLNQAVTRYESIVAPANYKRPKAIFTQKMLDEAKKTITEMGYLESLGRRHAKLDDITVNNILFANRDSAKRITGADDIFASMSKQVQKKPQKFDRVEEVSPETFVNDILPTATDVDVYLENKHMGNMVSLIAPKVPDSKTMFKWNNNFSWAYAGNMTDSMKELVKAKGGKVDGDLRFSIQWNDNVDHDDNSDLDAHCVTPLGFEIMFSNRIDRITNGALDVDIIDPRGRTAVENITWASRRTMHDGEYRFFAHMYSGSLKHGFRAEIEFDGQIFSFDYSSPVRCHQKVPVATVTLKNGVFTIKEHLPSTTASREVWGVKTNDFIPVSVVCYSPNYWDEQKGIGHQHLFFMLKDCMNPESPNGFYNEFLKSELVEHKRVFEALGAQTSVEKTPDQLSGVGFSMTKRDDIVVRVKGNTERVVKIKF